MNQLTPINDTLIKCYSPTELFLVFEEALRPSKIKATVVQMKGVYKFGNTQYPKYDKLIDEQTRDEITIIVSENIKAKAREGSIVILSGIIKKIFKRTYSSIELQMNVTQMEILEEKVTLSETDLRLIEIHKKKQSKGFKDVEFILNNKLYSNNRPKIGLLFPTTGQTYAEFETALAGTKEFIDFDLFDISFSQAPLFINKLKEMDSIGYDCIAIVRGGGSGLDNFNNPDILDSVIEMKTAVISAIGHKTDKFFLKDIVDKVVDTPTALGFFFKETAEAIIEQRRKSKAVLFTEIQNQFKDQIEVQKKQNETLQGQIKEMTEANKIALFKHNQQSSILQNQLKEITLSNAKKDTEAQKRSSELILEIRNLNTSRQKQDEASNKQLTDLAKQLRERESSINNLTITNGELNKELQRMNSRIHDLGQKSNSGCLGMAAAFIGVIVLLSNLF